MLHLSEGVGGRREGWRSLISLPLVSSSEMKAGGPALQSWRRRETQRVSYFDDGRPAELLSSKIISIHTQIAIDGCFIGAALVLTKREASSTCLSIVTVNWGWILEPSRKKVRHPFESFRVWNFSKANLDRCCQFKTSELETQTQNSPKTSFKNILKKRQKHLKQLIIIIIESNN